ncbi:MAG: MFS transporter [Saprospiraceae bacterium]
MIAHLSNIIGHPAARATGMVFTASGLILGTWSALIPYIKEKFGLDEAELGLLLLTLPAGVTLMNPFTVPIIHRLGAVRATLVSLGLTGLLFILPIASPFIWLLVPSLFLAGGGFSTLNVAMNTCASLLEQHTGLRIFSTCHGLWSVGAMVGSAMAGMATGWGMSPILFLSLLAVLALLTVFALRPALASVPDDYQPSTVPVKKSTGFIKPNKALWVLILISLCTNLAEGSMTDWSAVYMRDVAGAPEAWVGWGFAAYAFFMAGGRLLGDALLYRFSSKKVLRIGGVVAASGFLVSIFWTGMAGALLGFSLVGAGVSLGSPILYAAATKVPGLPKGAGLATMNTFAMVGFLGGPAFIGLLAKMFSLPTAFGVVACFALFWAAWSGRMR